MKWLVVTSWGQAVRLITLGGRKLVLRQKAEWDGNNICILHIFSFLVHHELMSRSLVVCSMQFRAISFPAEAAAVVASA